MKRKKTRRPFANPADDRRVQNLANTWGTISRAGRGKIIVPLLKDYTTRELARALPCSEKEVRNCADLSGTSSLKTEHHYSNNKLFKIANAFRASQRKWKKMSRGAAGKRLHQKLVRTLVKWFKENFGHPVRWETFFFELDWLPEARKEVFCGAPWNKCQPDGDWDAIIKVTRPADSRDTLWSLYSKFGFHRKWLGAWLSRCVQDGRFAKSALHDARRVMRHETKKIEAKIRKETGAFNDWSVGPLTLDPPRRVRTPNRQNMPKKHRRATL